jgi:hypothetical protein
MNYTINTENNVLIQQFTNEEGQVIQYAAPRNIKTGEARVTERYYLNTDTGEILK